MELKARTGQIVRLSLSYKESLQQRTIIRTRWIVQDAPGMILVHLFYLTLPFMAVLTYSFLFAEFATGFCQNIICLLFKSSDRLCKGNIWDLFAYAFRVFCVAVAVYTKKLILFMLSTH